MGPHPEIGDFRPRNRKIGPIFRFRGENLEISGPDPPIFTFSPLLVPRISLREIPQGSSGPLKKLRVTKIRDLGSGDPPIPESCAPVANFMHLSMQREKRGYEPGAWHL